MYRPAPVCINANVSDGTVARTVDRMNGGTIMYRDNNPRDHAVIVGRRSPLLILPRRVDRFNIRAAVVRGASRGASERMSSDVLRVAGGFRHRSLNHRRTHTAAPRVARPCEIRARKSDATFRARSRKTRGRGSARRGGLPLVSPVPSAHGPPRLSLCSLR